MVVVVVVVAEVVVIPLLPFLLEAHSTILPRSPACMHPSIHPSIHPRNVINLYYVPGIILGSYKTVHAFISTNI